MLRIVHGRSCPFTARISHIPLSFPRWPGVVGASLILALGSTAHAQQIDEYLATSIAGTGVEPGVTVTSRTHPEYDAQPLHLGGFLLSPSLDEGVGYDDNVNGIGKGGATIETSGTVRLNSNWSRDSVGLNLNVDDFRYPGESNQSYTNWSASLGGSADIGRSNFTGSYTHLNANETALDLDTPALDHPLAYRTDDVRGRYDMPFGQLTVSPGLEVSAENYDNGVANGQPYIQAYRDRVVVSPSIETRYDFSPRRGVVFVLRDDNADYTQTVAGVPKRNFNSISALGGIEYDITQLVSLRLLAGYQNQTFSNSAYRTVSAPVVEASVIYAPTELTTVTASASRYITDSASVNQAAYTETALKLRVDHEYLRNVILNANGSFYEDEYGSGGGSQNSFSLGVGATWLINRQMRLTASYTYSRRDSSNAVALGGGPFQPIGLNYVDNVALLQLHLNP